jgi:hypothetical protein
MVVSLGFGEPYPQQVRLSASGVSLKLEQEVRDLELVLWDRADQPEVDYPSGAAAAMALVAFVAFMIGLAVAAFALL